MREPYRTLFDGYSDHWLLGRYLADDEPDWSGLAGEPKLECLSRGESVLLDLAAALRNARLYLDSDHQVRVMLALHLIASGAQP